ncbi:MAG: hypothetical protein DDT19_00087 [Syntrophomonadaceae bacterium]|nr:hypothetical protein [Bacillota bacterium]
MSNYYVLRDKQAIPVDDVRVWGRAFEKDRVVRQETLPNGLFVSTVFLGIDHGWSEQKPLIFETMVFPSEADLNELDMERYSTWEEAEQGHQEMVEKWRNQWV